MRASFYRFREEEYGCDLQYLFPTGCTKKGLYFIFTFSLNKTNLIRAVEYELIHLCSVHLTLSCAETAGYEPFPF